MANLKIHAGDLPKCKATLSFGSEYVRVSLPWQPGEVRSLAGNDRAFHRDTIAELAIATEENVKRLGGTVGWGVAGAALLGPVGLLAGLLLGGKSKDVTFIMKLKDGRKILATTDQKTFTKLQAFLF